MFTRTINIILSLIYALVCSFFPIPNLYNCFSNTPSNCLAEERIKAQEPAIAAYQELIKEFGILEDGSPDYPDGYGGEYIDDDNNLIVLVKNMDEFKSTKYANSVINNPFVRLKEVTYSYKELLQYKWVVNEIIVSGINIKSYYVDIIKNRFLIGIQQSDYEEMVETGYLAQITSQYPIEFEIIGLTTAATSLYGGDRIHTNGIISSPISTVGICGTYNGNNAILTCGHGYNLNDSIYYNNTSSLIGTIVYQRANTTPGMQNTTQGTGDFSIVQVSSSSGYTMTNKVKSEYGTENITGVWSAVPLNTIIYKYGSTYGFAYGKVVQQNMVLDYSGYLVSGIYRISIEQGNAGQGDSGGPMWRIYNGSNYLHGILVATGYVDGVKYMYSSPIYPVINVGFSPKID